MTPLLRLYVRITRLATPLVHWHIRRRQRWGKEDGARIAERFGIAGRPRPQGALFWFHAASIGEALSALDVLRLVKLRHPQAHILFTTGTLTSAILLATRLPEGAIHQFVPVDTPAAAFRFLEHWKPDAGVLLESELWPNLILEAQRRHLPLALINARMSETSMRNWGYAPDTIAALLSGVEPILARSETDRLRYERLARKPVFCVGDLKHDATALAASEEVVAHMKAQMVHREIWVAASIHPGEETVLAEALAQLKKDHPRLLMILVPRHPERGKAMEAAIGTTSLHTARRSLAEPIRETTDIYIADTIGELGVWYRLADIAFIGGSLIPHGGQNPIEAIRLQVPVMFGSHMFNFDATRKELLRENAAQEATGSAQLAQCVHAWLADPPLRKQVANNASRWLARQPPVAEAVLARLAPLFQGASV